MPEAQWLEHLPNIWEALSLIPSAIPQIFFSSQAEEYSITKLKWQFRAIPCSLSDSQRGLFNLQQVKGSWSWDPGEVS